MNIEQRAAQLWSILALAATNRQILTYGIVSKLIGAPSVAIGGFLAPIQSYCLKNELPPLTIIVVNETTGLPGEGFIATTEISSMQQKVFKHNWLEKGAPKIDEFNN